jgi:alkylation response protein AidB-like acyl-CoA dehydrogenase
MTESASELESLEHFRARLRDWLPDNLPREERHSITYGLLSDEEELADVALNRDLQRHLYDAGFAGIVFPMEYGGAGLTPAHQEVFNEEISGYRFPSRVQIPTLTPCAAVLLEFGTEEQKREHLPAMLSGEELWMQMLSEPGGGSDVAGATATAVRDGGSWILNGSKIWTTGAWWSDWALALVRTNWDVPKHRGLTVFMIRLHQPNLEVHRIEMLNGAKEFCQEFMSDLVIPDSDRIGEVDAGWTVGIRWMYHEKSLQISPYVTRPAGGATDEGPAAAALELARADGSLGQPHTRQCIAEMHALGLASQEGGRRIAHAITAGRFSEHAAGLARILVGVNSTRITSLNLDLGGSNAVAWDADRPELGELGIRFLMRQASQIAGGTTEISRNVVAERFLGMPAEPHRDRNAAFRDVPR